MTEPRNLGAELDRLRHEAVEQRKSKRTARQAWAHEEAKRRLILRAEHDAEGKRQSCEDIRAVIVAARDNPEDPIGKAWVEYQRLLALCDKLAADYDTCKDDNWTAIDKGRYGI